MNRSIPKIVMYFLIVLAAIFVAVAFVTFVTKNSNPAQGALTAPTKVAAAPIPSATPQLAAAPVLPAKTEKKGVSTLVPSPEHSSTPIPSTPEPAVITPEILSDQPAQYYFVDVSDITCYPLNGPWTTLEKGQFYVVHEDNVNIFVNQDTFKYYEGVVTDASGRPIDTHFNFEITDGMTFTMVQGNIWECGIVTDEKAKITVLFKANNFKFQNWDSQPDKPFHSMEVNTKFHIWDYAAGVRPDWALNTKETSLACPYTEKPEMSNPLGEIQGDGTYIGTPGKASCDFVAILPSGKAIRYQGVIERFTYLTGTRFFLFDPSFTNETLATFLNVGVVTNAQ